MRFIEKRISIVSLLVVAILGSFTVCGRCSGHRRAQRKSLHQPQQNLQDYTPKLLEEPVASQRNQTRVIRYGSYTVAYHLEWQQPQWVAYRLDAERLRNVVGRKGYTFREDPFLGDCTLDNQDFKGTGYSRGHLKPAADSKSSAQAMQESFYYTNMSPQLPSFNSGIWNTLEMWVRRVAEKTDMLYVATGPCFLENPQEHMGHKKVPVATHFYKAILKRDGDKWNAVGFVVPHDLARKAKPWEFTMTVDSLEKLTRIDFFPLLPDSIELAVEACVDEAAWR